jgi:hypothetical protein
MLSKEASRRGEGGFELKIYEVVPLKLVKTAIKNHEVLIVISV